MNQTAKKLLNALILFVLLFSLTSTVNVGAGNQRIPLFTSGDLMWAKQVGGSYRDTPSDATIDSEGNIYVTGLTTGVSGISADFDPGPNEFNLPYSPTDDAFIAKYDNLGTLVWAKQIASSNSAFGVEVEADTNNNIYVLGSFAGTTDFDPGPSVFNISSTGGTRDTFLLKLDNNGNFVWVKTINGVSWVDARSLELDTNNNFYILLDFAQTADFDPGASTFNLTSNSANLYDIGILKLDNNGSFVWAKSFGGSSEEYSSSLAISNTGNLYITGQFDGTVDFNPNAGTFSLTSNSYDMFASALDNNGQFLWAISIGGSGIDDGTDIEIDSTSNLYITGVFYNTVDFDPGTGIQEKVGVGGSDIYVLKLNSIGELAWVSTIGGAGGDFANNIELDSSQDIYFSGYFTNTVDFDPSGGITNLTSSGFNDIFTAKFNNSGQLVWAKSMGGTNSYDIPYGLALDSGKNIFTTGVFTGTADFDPDIGSLNFTSAGETDIFIAKLDGGVSPFVSAITRASPSPTSAASVDFTVTFSEYVKNVDPGDFSLSKTGVITGESITNVSGSGSTRTVTVNTGSGNGTIRLDVPNTASISDMSGNSLSGLPFSTGQTYTITKALPDLIVTNVVLDPPTPSSGETFKVIITIKNQGGPTGLTTIYRDVYIGVDPLTLINPATGCPTPGNYFRLDTYINLDSGQSDTKTVSITGGLNNGAHQLWVYVDSRCLVHEVGEVNNGQ